MFRFGIFGTGNIAERFCNAARLVEDVQVAAVASKDANRAHSFAERMDVTHAYGDYREMLEDGELDAVYIATTTNYHYENLMLCIDMGVPALCEKGMVISYREAQEVFARAKEKSVFVMEGMWSRFIPAVQKAREWISGGRIGEVAIATYTGGVNAPADSRLMNPKLCGGALWDLAPYPIELVTYLVNQPLRGVESQLVYGETGVDVNCAILLQFDRCRAGLQCTTAARIPSPSGFYGNKGYVRLEQTHRADACELYDEEFRLVERFEHPIADGFEFEIMEVRDCVRLGKLESDIMPHSATLQCAEIFDICRKQHENRTN